MEERLKEAVAQAMYRLNARLNRGEGAWDEEAEGARAYWRSMADAAERTIHDANHVIIPEGRVEELEKRVDELEEAAKPKRRGRSSSPSLDFEVTLEEEDDGNTDLGDTDS